MSYYLWMHVLEIYNLQLYSSWKVDSLTVSFNAMGIREWPDMSMSQVWIVTVQIKGLYPEERSIRMIFLSVYEYTLQAIDGFMFVFIFDRGNHQIDNWYSFYQCWLLQNWYFYQCWLQNIIAKLIRSCLDVIHHRCIQSSNMSSSRWQMTQTKKFLPGLCSCLVINHGV